MKKKLVDLKLISLILILILFSLNLSSQGKEKINWGQFRGPNGSGVVETTGLVSDFGPQTNVIWKTPLAAGYSSPVLTPKYIFLTAVEDKKLFTICLNRDTGKIVWKREAPRPRKEKIDGRNNPASPSPVVDDRQVVVFFPDFGLLAYDFNGQERWRLALGPFDNLYGMGASPVLVDEKVILVVDQNVGSYILAVNKHDGKEAWKTPRPEARSGHSTPIVWKTKGKSQILVPGSFLLTAYTAETGKKVWWVGGLSFEMKSTPVIHKGLLFINGYATPLNQPDKQVKIPDFKEAVIQFDKDKNQKLSKEELPKTSPYPFFDFVDLAHDGFLDRSDWNYFQAALRSLNGMLAIRLGGSGDMSKQNTVWQYRRNIPQLPSPLIYNNILYMMNDGGRLTTFNPETGQVINKGRLKGGGTHFYASPVAADGKVFIISRKGKVSVLKPDGSLELLAVNDLKEMCYATPAIAEGKIYIRTVKTLYCFGGTGSQIP